MKTNKTNSSKGNKGNKEKNLHSDNEVIEKSHPVLKSPKDSTVITTKSTGTVITRNQRWGPENKQ